MFRKQLRIIIMGWLAFLLSLAVATAGYAADSWQIRINVPEYRLYLYHGTELYRSFYVAVGKTDSPSPIGEYWVANKVVNPTWYPPDKRRPVPPGPNNPLGKYWLGLNHPGYGIHGNNAEWSIGSSVSLGCFRMHNADIETLFNLVPVKTPVIVEYQSVVGRIDTDGRAWLSLFPDIYQLEQPNQPEQAILGLNWIGEPHWQALGTLLKHKRPFVIEVPRIIRLDGDLLGNDGFYWNQEFYSNGLPATGQPSEFPGYQPLKALAASETGRWKLLWQPENDTLEVYRFKVLLNEVSVAGAGRQSADGRLEINRGPLAVALHLEPVPRPVQSDASDADNSEWLDLKTVTAAHPELRYTWDEVTWTLRLTTGTGTNTTASR